MANEWKNDDAFDLTYNSVHDDSVKFGPFQYQMVQINWMFYTIDVVCPIAIFGGVFMNILAFVVLVRSRLWSKHEGYVYLAVNFWANVGILAFCTSSFWMTSAHGWGDYYPPNTSNFMCKFWNFLMNIFFVSGWLSVALLFNVNLREHLTQQRTGCGCLKFAAKYCTLFATKIIVGVIFSVLLVFGVPYLVIYGSYPDEHCVPSRLQSMQDTLLAETMLMYALPCLIFLPVLFSMLCRKREGIIIGLSEVQQKSVYDDQMRTMAVTLSSITFLSQLARILLYFETGRFLLASIHIQIELMFSASLALQPIFCFVILKALRDGFCSQMRNICCCCRRQSPSLDRGEEVVQYIAIQEDPPNPTGS